MNYFSSKILRGNSLFNAYHISGEVKMDNSDVMDVKDILDVDRGPATPQLSKEAIMGSLKVN